MKITGIYKIQSQIHSERCYIGSAVIMSKRWTSHLHDLRKNKHHSIKLQRHYNKYGESDLIFSILLGCEKEDLIKIEQYFLDSYKPYFNICLNAGSPLGRRFSPESRKKIGDSNRGKISSMKGKHHSEETKQKQSMALLGKKHSKERIVNSSNGHKGIRHSEESNRKGGETRKGHIVTEQTREKIRRKLTGQKHTEERRINIGLGHKGMKSWNKGRKMSLESRKKMSESKKGKIAWNKGRKFIEGKYICQN